MPAESGNLSKAFIVALIGVACSPLSAGLAWYASHALAAPRFEVVDVTVDIRTENHKIEPAVLKQIQSNISLVVELKRGLKDAGAAEECKAWLNDKPWQDSCAGVVTQSVTDLQNIIDAVLQDLEWNINTLQRWHGHPAPLELRPIPIDALKIPFAIADHDPTSALTQFRGQLASARRDKKDVDVLAQWLRKIADNPDTPRTGDADFIVKLLNSGDSDGVIRPAATLKFAGTELPLIAADFTVVEKHKLAEIQLSVATNGGTETASAKLKKLLLDYAPEEIQIVLSTGKEKVKVTADSNLPPK
jgi:hypothetical protein